MPDQSGQPSVQDLHIRLTELENSVKSLQESTQRQAALPQVCVICQQCYVCQVCHVCVTCICSVCRPVCYECGGCGPCLQSGIR